jgi:hypothetical protein
MKASGIFLSVNTEVGESIGTRDRFCGLTEFSLNATAGKLHVRLAAKMRDGQTINHGLPLPQCARRKGGMIIVRLHEAAGKEETHARYHRGKEDLQGLSPLFDA